MAMATQVQAQVSKKNTVVLGGNMALRRGMGGGTVTCVLRRQTSPVSSIEVLGMVGIRSILSLQTSRWVFVVAHIFIQPATPTSNDIMNS